MASAPTANPVPFKASDVNVKLLKYGLDNSPTFIEDRLYEVVISSPEFSVSAKVEFPILPPGTNIQLGWIQVCTEMDVISRYGDVGIASWEIPELLTGKYDMISDADGSQYPWYASGVEVTSIKGPTNSKTTRTVYLVDSLETTFGWDVPIVITPEPPLTFLYRKQKFYNYLVLKDVITSTYTVLAVVTWTIQYAVEADVSNPVGKRCQLLGPFQQQCPAVVPINQAPKLQCYALKPPICNTAQVLLWRSDTETGIIEPPQDTTVDINDYMLNSDAQTDRLMLITKDNFLQGKL